MKYLKKIFRKKRLKVDEDELVWKRDSLRSFS